MTAGEWILLGCVVVALVAHWLAERTVDQVTRERDDALAAEQQERQWREDAETELRRARADARAGRHPVDGLRLVGGLRLVEPLPPAGSVFNHRLHDAWPKDSA